MSSFSAANLAMTLPAWPSHAEDDSKKLKYEQRVAIKEAVVAALQFSAAMIRRNMQMHDSPTKSDQDNSSGAHAQLPGLQCQQICVCPTT
jgi:hypothetical protein